MSANSTISALKVNIKAFAARIRKVIYSRAGRPAGGLGHAPKKPGITRIGGREEGQALQKQRQDLQGKILNANCFRTKEAGEA